jgi:hypothetical protein
MISAAYPDGRRHHLRRPPTPAVRVGVRSAVAGALVRPLPSAVRMCLAVRPGLPSRGACHELV